MVHEWGTFTTLQAPGGRALGAINEDVEPLPDFVKNLISSERGPKGFPVHPEVTMRLETPVVYFHLPKGAAPIQLDYTASFKSGLLTQFYPSAGSNYTPQQAEDFGKTTSPAHSPGKISPSANPQPARRRLPKSGSRHAKSKPPT